MALTVTKGTADEVHASAGAASSVTAVSPAAGQMVRWCVAWLNTNDTLGLTFTAADSNGTSYGAPTLKPTSGPGDDDGGCYLLVWDHVYATAPGAVTLTVTASGSGVSAAAPSDCLILPYLISGQAADQGTAAFKSFNEVGTPTTTYEIALATTQAGSQVFVLAAPNYNGGATGAVTPIAGTATDVDWQDSGVGSRGTFGRGTSVTGTPGSTTFGWTSANPSPNGYGVMASEVLPEFAPVGSPVYVDAPTFTLAPANAGDLIAGVIMCVDNTQPVTALSSSNVTWTNVRQVVISGANTYAFTAFKGVVTSTSSQTVTLTGGSLGAGIRGALMEFSTAVGASSVSLDTSATLANTTATADWPSITPGHGAGELFAGYEYNEGAATAGSTAGYTYEIDSHGNGFAYDTAFGGGAGFPVWGDTDQRTVLEVLLYPAAANVTSSGAAGFTPGVSGTAAEVFTGSAAVAFRPGTAGTVQSGLGSAGAVTFSPSVSGTVAVPFTASAAVAFSPAVAATGAVPFVTTGAVAFRPSAAATGLTGANGTASAGFSPSVAATGTVAPPVSTSGAAGLSLTVSGAATFNVTSTGAVAFSASVAGSLVPPAGLAQSFRWNGSSWVPYQYGTNGILAEAVTAEKIQAGTITAAQIAAGTITAANLVAGLVVAGIVDATTITGATLIADGSNGEIFVYSGAPAAGNLILSVAAAGGTDPHGNTYPAGLTVGESGNEQVQVASLSGRGQLNFVPASSSYVYGQLSQLVIGSYEALGLYGPNNTAAGHTDYAGVTVNSSDGSADAYGGLIYVPSSGTIDTIAVWGAAGLVANGAITAVDPATGTQAAPAQAETWHDITPDSGWTIVVQPQYRLLPDGNVQLSGELTRAGTTSGVNVNGSNPIPSAYWPSTTRYYRPSDSGLSAGTMQVSSAGVIAMRGSGFTATTAVLDGIYAR